MIAKNISSIQLVFDILSRITQNDFVVLN